MHAIGWLESMNEHLASTTLLSMAREGPYNETCQTHVHFSCGQNIRAKPWRVDRSALFSTEQ